MTQFKVISGGQRGVDLAALQEAALCGFETGGTAHRDADPEMIRQYKMVVYHFPVYSFAQGLVARSKKNVDDADVTIAFLTASHSGTHKTAGYCQSRRWGSYDTAYRGDPYRPVLVLTQLATREECDQQVERIVSFLAKMNPKVVNVCGHRDDRTASLPGYERSVRYVLKQVFQRLKVKDV